LQLDVTKLSKKFEVLENEKRKINYEFNFVKSVTDKVKEQLRRKEVEYDALTAEFGKVRTGSVHRKTSDQDLEDTLLS